MKTLNTLKIEATLHLGDIVDGNDTLEHTKQDLERVLLRLADLNTPVWHVLGNHCLAAGENYVKDRLGLKHSYYFHDVSEQWRVVVLDTVEVSVDRDGELREKAKKYLVDHSGEANAKEWNGGLSPTQKSWLRTILHDARQRGFKAIVCGHLPVLSEDAFRQHVIWENEALAELFAEYADVVKAYFAGHFHDGGYQKRDSVHYVTVEAVLDSETEEGAFGMLELFEHRIVVKGYGDVTSRVLEW